MCGGGRRKKVRIFLSLKRKEQQWVAGGGVVEAEEEEEEEEEEFLLGSRVGNLGFGFFGLGGRTEGRTEMLAGPCLMLRGSWSKEKSGGRFWQVTKQIKKLDILDIGSLNCFLTLEKGDAAIFSFFFLPPAINFPPFLRPRPFEKSSSPLILFSKQANQPPPHKITGSRSSPLRLPLKGRHCLDWRFGIRRWIDKTIIIDC